jgi:primosomal protein N' (replication factor Y)
MNKDIKTIGPLPSLMEKKSGVYRWEVSLFSSSRKSLHSLTDHLQSFLYLPKQTRKVRWSIDVDPISTI